MGVTKLQLPATLREATVEHLQEQIVTGVLKPGELLKDSVVAAELGLSPTPVREALVQLAGIGLVEIESNRLKRVAPMNLENMRELAAVQRVLWETGYAWGVPNVDDTVLGLLAESLEEETSCLQKGDKRGAWLAHTDFHSAVVAAAGNRELNRVIVDRFPLLERLILMHMSHTLSDEMLTLDRAIYDALAQGERAEAIAIGETIRAKFSDEINALCIES